ncbi:MAG: WD40 repeat domain-containing protein [Vampirovibrionales bacterium]
MMVSSSTGSSPFTEKTLRGYNQDTPLQEPEAVALFDAPEPASAVDTFVEAERHSGLFSAEDVTTLNDTDLLREALKRLVEELRPVWQNHVNNTPVGCYYVPCKTPKAPEGVLWVVDLEGNMELIAVDTGESLWHGTLIPQAETGEDVEILSCHVSPAYQASPDAPYHYMLACGSSTGMLQVWSLETETLQCQPVHQALVCPEVAHPETLWVEHLAFAHTKVHQPPRVLVIADKQLRAWDMIGTSVPETPKALNFQLKPLRVMAEAPQRILGLAWSPSSIEHFIVGGYQGLWRCRVGDLQPHQSYAWPGVMLNTHWSSDSKYIACGCQDTSLHMWEVKSGKDFRMRGFQGKVNTLAWHPHHLTLAASGGNDISLWDCTGTGPAEKVPLQLLGHLNAVRSLAYSPTGRWLASGGEDGEVLVWDTQSPTPVPGSPEDDPLYLPLLRVDSELLNPDHTSVTHLQWHEQGLLIAYEDGLLGYVGLTLA